MSFSSVLFVRLPIFGNMTKLLPVYCINVDRVQKSPIHDHCGISNGKGAKGDAERTPDRPLPSCNATARITGVTKSIRPMPWTRGSLSSRQSSIQNERQTGRKIIPQKQSKEYNYSCLSVIIPLNNLPELFLIKQPIKVVLLAIADKLPHDHFS